MHQHHDEFIKKMVILLSALGIVLGIFFAQQHAIVSKSSQGPTPTPMASTTGNIIVTSPIQNATVPADFMVHGRARINGNALAIRVSNKVLGKVYFQSQSTPQTGTNDFIDVAAEVHMKSTDRTLRPNDKLLLEVYQVSPDGKEFDHVSVPLYFGPDLP